MSKREKLLEKARRTQNGWMSDELCHLYELWGFKRPPKSGHGGELKYYHPKYPELGVAPVTKSSGAIHPFYVRDAVRDAVKLIDAVNVRENP